MEKRKIEPAEVIRTDTFKCFVKPRNRTLCIAESELGPAGQQAGSHCEKDCQLFVICFEYSSQNRSGLSEVETFQAKPGS